MYVYKAMAATWSRCLRPQAVAGIALGGLRPPAVRGLSSLPWDATDASDARVEQKRARRRLQVGRKVQVAIAEQLLESDALRTRREGTRVTITGVVMSNDMRAATVLWLPAPGSTDNVRRIQAALTHQAKHLRYGLAKKAELRFAPRLSFRFDGVTLETQRVHDIINYLARERADRARAAERAHDDNVEGALGGAHAASPPREGDGTGRDPGAGPRPRPQAGGAGGGRADSE